MGDCWFLAACAGIVNVKSLFEKVIPKDQSFQDNYNGNLKKGVLKSYCCT